MMVVWIPHQPKPCVSNVLVVVSVQRRLVLSLSLARRRHCRRSYHFFLIFCSPTPFSQRHLQQQSTQSASNCGVSLSLHLLHSSSSLSPLLPSFLSSFFQHFFFFHSSPTFGFCFVIDRTFRCRSSSSSPNATIIAYLHKTPHTHASSPFSSSSILPSPTALFKFDFSVNRFL